MTLLWQSEDAFGGDAAFMQPNRIVNQLASISASSVNSEKSYSCAC